MIKIDLNNISSASAGQANGLDDNSLFEAVDRFSGIIPLVLEEHSRGGLGFMNLPYQPKLVREIDAYAVKNAKKYDNFVVLGIGGSALGASAVHTAINTPFHNLLPDRKRKSPRMFFPDNVDPEEIAFLANNIDAKKTMFNVISKSGDTAEILANFQIFLKILKTKLGRNYRNNLIITTDREKGFLRKFADREGIKSFEVPQGVGGRFSVFSPVGLVPLAFAGVNNAKLLKGAATMDSACRNTEPYRNPAFMLALANYLMDTKKGKSIIVMMAYSESLREVADWFCQLWGESLGKRYKTDGSEIYCGQTPVKAIGATDQHSQIQLYNEGPNNKLIVFIEVEKFRENVKIPGMFPEQPEAGYLNNKTLTELLNKEKTGTEIALTKNGRPNYTVKMKNISEETVGGLLHLWEAATVFAGKLYGINAFDQPGVEAGKNISRALMGQKGTEKTSAEISGLAEKHSQKLVISV
ncbi:MAG: glucose-6-phosphate isomerase [Planctomycetes bacterium]|nr:glucose-6-phosphate isomerase [Planctomycetota bacterium]